LSFFGMVVPLAPALGGQAARTGASGIDVECAVDDRYPHTGGPVRG